MDVIIQDSVVYERHRFNLERELEEVVFANHQFLFGRQSIFFDKRMMRTVHGVGTIPDGFVIDPRNEKWYVVEIELAHHHVYNHILSQIVRFQNALGPATRTRHDLKDFFDRQLQNDLTKKAVWVSATNDTDIYRRLSGIIDKKPELVIVIDNPNAELLDAVTQLSFKTKINVFKTYCREGCGLVGAVHQFESFEPQSITVVASNKLMVTTNSVTFTPLQTLSASPQPQTAVRTNSPSPSATEWIRQIPELAQVGTLRNWKDICRHLQIPVGAASARLVLENWVAAERPHWSPVPKPQSPI
jgi:hypothetical protein